MKHSLTQGSILKGLFFFVVPLFFSNLFQQLYNTIDTVLIGHYLGDASLAAMGATAAVFELIVGFCNGVGLGFGIVIARYYGSKDIELLKKSVASSLILGLIISLSLTFISYLGLPLLLNILHTPANIYQEALSYIQCIALFLSITMFYNLGAGLLRAIGDSFTPLLILFVSSLINVILDILCITTWNMGIVGAAVATVIAQLISTILCFIVIFKKAKILIPERKHFQLEGFIVSDLLGQGFSMGFMLSIVSIGTVILQSSINGLGTKIIAAHTAARKLTSLMCLPLSTLAASMATFVSQNHGAKQYERIIKGVKIANVSTAIYAIILTIVVFMFSTTFVHLISGSNDPVVLHNGSLYLKTNIPFFIVLGVLLNTRNAIQGFGKKLTPLVSSIIELIGKVVFTALFIPSLNYLGVCFCEPVIWILMTIQLVYAYRKIIQENN